MHCGAVPIWAPGLVARQTVGHRSGDTQSLPSELNVYSLNLSVIKIIQKAGSSSQNFILVFPESRTLGGEQILPGYWVPN